MSEMSRRNAIKLAAAAGASATAGGAAAADNAKTGGRGDESKSIPDIVANAKVNLRGVMHPATATIGGYNTVIKSVAPISPETNHKERGKYKVVFHKTLDDYNVYVSAEGRGPCYVYDLEPTGFKVFICFLDGRKDDDATSNVTFGAVVACDAAHVDHLSMLIVSNRA